MDTTKHTITIPLADYKELIANAIPDACKLDLSHPANKELSDAFLKHLKGVGHYGIHSVEALQKHINVYIVIDPNKRLHQNT